MVSLGKLVGRHIIPKTGNSEGKYGVICNFLQCVNHAKYSQGPSRPHHSITEQIWLPQLKYKTILSENKNVQS